MIRQKTFRAKLRSFLQPLLRALKLKRYCRFGLNGLDHKLGRYLDFDGGFFVEAGANNGILQSNTYYLEAIRGWSGVLVEPCPELFDACLKNRPRANVVQAALVSGDYEKETISLEFAGLMTAVDDEERNAHYSEDLVNIGRGIHEIQDGYRFEAPARTLSSILDDFRGREVDFMSLDLEGYEVNALQGIDFERHRPRYLLIEVRDRAEIDNVIGRYYDCVATLSENERHSDLLYKRRVAEGVSS